MTQSATLEDAITSVVRFFFHPARRHAQFAIEEIAEATNLDVLRAMAAVGALAERGCLFGGPPWSMSANGVVAALVAAASTPIAPPAWTTGAYVSDLVRVAQGAVGFKLGDGIEQAEMAVRGSATLAKDLAALLGQKGVLTFRVGDGEYALAAELAAKRAEVKRLRDLLASAEKAAGVQQVRVEMSFRTCILTASSEENEQRLGVALAKWLLDEGARHPDVGKEIDAARAERDKERGAMVSVALTLHDMHMAARAVIEAEGPESRGAAVSELAAFVAAQPAHLWAALEAFAREADGDAAEQAHP